MNTATESVYIDGGWVDSRSSRVLMVRSPSTEEIVGRVPDADIADIAAAVKAARAAFDHGPWPRMRPTERSAVMQALLAELTSRADELAHLIGRENGTPEMLLRPAQVDNGLDVLRYYAELATDFEVE